MWWMYWISCHTLIDSRLCVVPGNPTSNESRVSLLRRQGSTWRPWWSSQSLRRLTATSHLSPIYRFCQHGSSSAPHVTSLSSLSWRVYALRTIFLPWAEGRSQFQSLVWCRLQKSVWIWSTNESSVKIHTNCCEGEVVFILSLFEDCVRGQHVCLADAERSSSQPITNEYWGYVWLSLALITNYVRLYSWKWVKILLRPFWSHFTYPQSRILSPFPFWLFDTVPNVLIMELYLDYISFWLLSSSFGGAT